MITATMAVRAEIAAARAKIAVKMGIAANKSATLNELARRLGVSPRTVSNWLQGRNAPSGPAMRLLSEINK